MEVTVLKLGPCQARVSFTVPSEEFQGQVRRALGEAGRSIRMKGFRPGHVPPQVIEKQIGPQVRRDAIEHFVRAAYERAVEENALKVVGTMGTDVAGLQVIEGADLAHQFEISLRPEIELGEYKGLAIESELEPVMDAEIASALESFKVQQAHPEPAGEEGLPLFGLALAKVQWLAGPGGPAGLSGTSGDDVVLERDGLRLSPETPTPGVEPEAFQKALLGAKDGDTRELQMTFPPDFDREELRGKHGRCRVIVTQAYRMVPPTEDEVRKVFGAEDDASLQRAVRARIEEAKREREQTRVEAALLERLLAAHPFDLPEPLLDQQTESRVAGLRRELEQVGTPAERIEEQVQSRRDAARDAASKGLRALFLVQAIAERESLLVSHEDLRKELEVIAARNGVPIEEVAEYYKQNSLYDQMAIEILERKVRKFLRENAQITEPK